MAQHLFSQVQKEHSAHTQSCKDGKQMEGIKVFLLEDGSTTAAELVFLAYTWEVVFESFFGDTHTHTLPC